MDYNHTSFTIINFKENKQMNKKSKLYMSTLSLVASTFALVATAITYRGSVFMWGEPKCPKDLLK